MFSVLNVAGNVLVFLLPLLFWWGNRRLGTRKLPIPVVMFAAWLDASLLFLGVLSLTDLELRRDLKRYDLNQDGEYSGDEITPEMKAAMKRWATDTGRSMAPAVAPVVALVWVCTCFAVAATVDLCVKNARADAAP